jgi:hypothetical protein
MTKSARDAGIEVEGRRLADRTQTKEERLQAAKSLAERSRGDWAGLPEGPKAELAKALLEVIGNSDENLDLRVSAAKALRVPIRDLPMETNEELFAVLSLVVQEGVDKKMVLLLAETCQLVSASRVMDCENEALLKGLNDAIFNAVLLGKSTDDEIFTGYADDAFGRSRNRINQLNGDWD